MDRDTTLALVNRSHKTKCKWLHTHRETGCVMKRMNIKPLTKSLLLIAKQLIAKPVTYSSSTSLPQITSKTHAALNVTEQAYHSNTTIKYTTHILIKLFDECKPEHQDISFPDKTLLLRLKGLTVIAIKSEIETKKMKIMNLYILRTNNITKAHGQGM